MTEKVDHPEHYNPGVYEVINIIEHYNLGFHLGNVLKYILRADKKHDTPKEDIEKAIWYLKRYLENLEKETPDDSASIKGCSVIENYQHHPVNDGSEYYYNKNSEW